MGRTRLVLIALVLAAITGVAFAGWRYSARSGWGGAPLPDGPIPGDGERVVVEVLNGTNVDGLARAVTRRLRGDGIDVVYYGSVRDSIHTATQILVRRGDTTFAQRVRRSLGFGTVYDRPDARRLLDLTVILGLDAVPDPPSQPGADRTRR